MTSLPDDFEEGYRIVVSEPSIDRDQEVMDRERRLFTVPHEINVDRVLVEQVVHVGVLDFDGLSCDVEDLCLVDEDAGGLRIVVCVRARFGNRQAGAVPIKGEIQLLTLKVLVGLAIIHVECSVGKAADDVGVDQEVDWVVNCLKQGHLVLFEVEHRQNRSLTDPGSLFLFGDGHGDHVGLSWNKLAGPEVIPVVARRQVNRHVVRCVENDRIVGWRAGLWRDEHS